MSTQVIEELFSKSTRLYSFPSTCYRAYRDEDTYVSWYFTPTGQYIQGEIRGVKVDIRIEGALSEEAISSYRSI